MWVLFVKDYQLYKRGNCVWANNDDDGQDMIDLGVAVRATGPEGKSIYDDTPENVIEAFKREGDHRFATPKVKTKKIRHEK